MITNNVILLFSKTREFKSLRECRLRNMLSKCCMTFAIWWSPPKPLKEACKAQRSLSCVPDRLQFHIIGICSDDEFWCLEKVYLHPSRWSTVKIIISFTRSTSLVHTEYESFVQHIANICAGTDEMQILPYRSLAVYLTDCMSLSLSIDPSVKCK